MDRNQKRWLWISLGFSAVVLVAVLYFTVDAATISYLQQLNFFGSFSHSALIFSLSVSGHSGSSS